MSKPRIRFTLSNGCVFYYEPKMYSATTIAAVAEDIASVARYTRQGVHATPLTLAAIGERHGVNERTVKRIRRRMLGMCAIRRAAS